MAHFFVPPFGDAREVTLCASDAHHAARVLRVRSGEAVTICDGTGCVWRAVFYEVSPERVTVELTDDKPFYPEPSTGVTVYAAQSKSGKWEHILQKCVEIGAKRLVPVITERCVSREPVKNHVRLQTIAREAAMQSRRGIIPEVAASVSFRDALRDAAAAEIRLFCDEDERRLSVGQALTGKTPRTVALFTGPEGGFSRAESEEARNAGCLCVSLGARILRCETAPVSALTMILYITGGMEPLET